MALHYGTSMAFLTSLKDVIQALLYYLASNGVLDAIYCHSRYPAEN